MKNSATTTNVKKDVKNIVKTDNNNVDANNLEQLKKSLQDFKKDAKNLEKFSKATKEKSILYKFQLNAEKLSFEDAKKLRQKNRNKLFSFCRNICFFFLSDNTTELQKSIKDFEIFYKETYIKNDFSLQSIFNGREEDKKKDLQKMLDIIKLTKATK